MSVMSRSSPCPVLSLVPCPLSVGVMGLKGEGQGHGEGTVQGGKAQWGQARHGKVGSGEGHSCGGGEGGIQLGTVRHVGAWRWWWGRVTVRSSSSSSLVPKGKANKVPTRPSQSMLFQ